MTSLDKFFLNLFSVHRSKFLLICCYSFQQPNPIISCGVLSPTRLEFHRTFSVKTNPNHPIPFEISFSFRYPYYAIRVLNTENRLITWCRYTLWVVLYPLGAGLEGSEHFFRYLFFIEMVVCRIYSV